MPFRFFATPLICLGLLAACSWPEPYILDTNEFNREAEGFKKPITDRSRFAVCYNTRQTTYAEVLAFAQEECAKFGKEAVASRGETLNCSISAPGSTVFNCVAPVPAGQNAPAATRAPAPTTPAQAAPVGAAAVPPLPRNETVAPWNAPWPPRPSP